jgi:Skp family chaperone for outer membrane proteins
MQAQKIGYVSTETIKTKFEPYLMAQQKLDQLVLEWKGEIEQMQKDVEGLELEMKKNRLIWSDAEREQHQKELDQKRRKREDFAREVFEPGGRYDQEVESMMKGIWEKIYLGIQQAAAADGYDIVWDKSTDPLVYVNPKYDLTVKVMKVLGIDADSLEKRQKDVIDTDPRNKGQRETIKRGSRRRSTSREEPQDTTSVNPVGGPSAPIGTNPANLPPMEQPTPPPADTTRNDEDIPR